MTAVQRVNDCLYSGALVGDEAAVPTDPTLFATQGIRTRPRLGCANLVCRDCGAAVRRSAGRTLIANTVDSAALYTAEDWADGVLTTTSSDLGALYTCRCKTEWTSSAKVAKMAKMALDAGVNTQMIGMVLKGGE